MTNRKRLEIRRKIRRTARSRTGGHAGLPLHLRHAQERALAPRFRLGDRAGAQLLTVALVVLFAWILVRT